MIDERLRELETRWKASGRLEDEVAWLDARLEAGAVSPLRLSLAAWLGSAAARRLCPEDPGTYADLIWWEDKEHEKASGYLATYGASALTRILLASCWARPKTHRLTKEGRRRRALYWVEESLIGEGGDQRVALEDYARRVRPDAAVATWDRAWERYQVNLPNMVVEFCLDPSPATLRTAWAARGVDVGAHLEAKAEVVPWALGYGDPLLERVESRSR